MAFAVRRVLTYVWDTTAPQGTMANASSIPLLRVFAVVCQSGTASLNLWIAESRNTAADLQAGVGPTETAGAAEDQRRKSAHRHFRLLAWCRPKICGSALRRIRLPFPGKRRGIGRASAVSFYVSIAVHWNYYYVVDRNCYGRSLRLARKLPQLEAVFQQRPQHQGTVFVLHFGRIFGGNIEADVAYPVRTVDLKRLDAISPFHQAL